jgi:hypothetical protein
MSMRVSAVAMGGRVVHHQMMRDHPVPHTDGGCSGHDSKSDRLQPSAPDRDRPTVSGGDRGSALIWFELAQVAVRVGLAVPCAKGLCRHGSFICLHSLTNLLACHNLV